MTRLVPPLRIAALWGDEHPELGEIATARLDPAVELALSRGRLPKPYPYLDPNEDAVVAATDGAAYLVAVADGHSGFEAARAALRAVLESASSLLGDPDGEAAVRGGFQAAHQAVTSVVAAAEGPRRSSRTALSLARVRDGRLHAAGRGDTVVVLVRGETGRLLVRRVDFLGPESDLDRLVVEEAELQPEDRLVLASDGLSDFLGPDWTTVVARTALGARPAEGLLRAAFAGGAGDNVAVAVYRQAAGSSP